MLGHRKSIVSLSLAMSNASASAGPHLFAARAAMKGSYIQTLLGISAMSLCATVLSGANACADDFTFSFTNNYFSGVAGTVTGEIFGLTNNSTSAASEVIVYSYPTFASNPGNLGPAPINVTAWTYQMYNQFTESDGAITYDNFAALDSSNNGFIQLFGGTNLSGPGPYLGVFGADEAFSLDQKSITDGDSYLAAYSPGPLPGYSLVPTSIVPTPEPTSVFLLAGVLLAVAFAARKRIFHVRRSV
jgi:hypothetical protein